MRNDLDRRIGTSICLVSLSCPIPLRSPSLLLTEDILQVKTSLPDCVFNSTPHTPQYNVECVCFLPVFSGGRLQRKQFRKCHNTTPQHCIGGEGGLSSCTNTWSCLTNSWPTPRVALTTCKICSVNCLDNDSNLRFCSRPTDQPHAERLWLHSGGGRGKPLTWKSARRHVVKQGIAVRP